MLGAIIQARMSSSRLPGKVLKEVNGQPILFYLWKRLCLSTEIKKIVLATSKDSSDDCIAAWAKSNGILLYRGNLEDVLDRYYFAAKENNLDDVMRITADCPLIDSAICDQLIRFYKKSCADYAQLSPRFAEGLDCEVISFSALEKSKKEARLPSERAHVTLYARNHPKEFRCVILENSSDDSRYRITVDNPEDFEVVSSILSHFLKNGTLVTAFWPALREFLDQNPALMKKNACITRNEGLQKSLLADQIPAAGDVL